MARRAGKKATADYRKVGIDLGDAIRERREALGLSLSELARRVGINKVYLLRIERGEYPGLGDNVLVSIARELGVVTDDLFALAGRVSPDVVAYLLAAGAQRLDALRAEMTAAGWKAA